MNYHQSNCAFPPAIFALVLQFLCYGKLGNKDKRDESLCELSITIQHDGDYHIHRVYRSVSWQLQGICQQMSGDYQAAFHSYRMALRLQRLSIYNRTSYVRLGTVLAHLFWVTNVKEICFIRYTVYSVEFAQSYFCLLRIWDWFAPSWIRPLSSFLTQA